MRKLRVAYHSACSLQHGQRVTKAPMEVLRACGFEVVGVPEGHICCGSAGTYNLLQPEIADQLKRRKAANIETTRPDVVAAGNIGCMVQIAGATAVPVVHTVELIDWATGGPRPAKLATTDQVLGPNHVARRRLHPVPGDVPRPARPVAGRRRARARSVARSRRTISASTASAATAPSTTRRPAVARAW